ncbi:TMV resistance protein N-like [Cicer arietinum]|uniref:TMV resistance protein N-like n=1 Tax=Cicer arietinum TaxID=3827 RepID=A0A1S2Z533_CICAR|nr:TMV resistance protein N-like [Cicer arietinum]
MAMESSHSSSSSFSYGFSYHVFISFRGSDTRHGFTGNLYKALMDKGIHTFIDDNDLERGDEITTSLIKTIENSRIFIPVFSINYASSSFCLDELVHIINCFKEKSRSVLPIFYDVDPTDVRYQTGSYGEELTKHEERLQDDKERLKQWKLALNQAANLSGFHFISGQGYEYKFIVEIVECISKKINRIPLHVADYPVGLQSQLQQVKLLLDEESDEKVHVVGLYSTGGMGKSTLAKAIYNFVADQFDGLCFLDNVRDNSTQNNLKHLQEELLLKTIGLDTKLGSVSYGIPIIKERLQRKKILLILDDVDKLDQLHALAGELDWFGNGSRVIITTRDKHLLTSHEIKSSYEVEGLNEKDALELLRWMAFKNNIIHPSYEDILNRVVTYASGLPLALEVVGSNLYRKDIQEWKSLIDEYERIPNKDIQEILLVSFNNLSEYQQNVFLDIACCFKGYSLKEVENILSAHYGLCMIYQIGVLVDKSLIKINEVKYVTLHNLIEMMGKEIVRKESVMELGERSRLWFYKDIVHVLTENTGSKSIQIIHLDCPSTEVVIDLNGKAFEMMENLKTLIIKSGSFSKGSMHLPRNLRVFKWQTYHSECIPSNLLNKIFVYMKILKFDNCKYLTEIPDVSSFPNLENISFEYCKNLITIHNSIGFLCKLKFLNAEGCDKIMSFPPLKLTSLKKLQINGCKSLQNFPEILDKMEYIETISIDGTSIEGFPASFKNLTGLVDLSIIGKGFFTLPSTICEIPNLSTISYYYGNQTLLLKQNGNMSSTVSSNVTNVNLQISNISDEGLPILLKWFANVKELKLSHSNFKILPECLEECRFLRILELNSCKSLEEIRGIPPNLKYISALRCKSLKPSTKSMLLNQQVHEAGETAFHFPSVGDEMIPKWFEHQSKGRISFWFRNRIPSFAIFVSTTKEYGYISNYSISLDVRLLVNDDEWIQPFPYFPTTSPSWNLPNIFVNHTNVFELQLRKRISHVNFRPQLEGKWQLISKLKEAFLKNEWIQMKLELRDCGYLDAYDWRSLPKFGIHFVKEKNNMEDIKFSNPNRKRKLDEYLNTSLSLLHPLFKKHKFVEMEVFEKELIEQPQHRHSLASLLGRLQI